MHDVILPPILPVAPFSYVLRFTRYGHDCRAGGCTLFEPRECVGVTCLSQVHVAAMLPSMLKPVFETVTGEAPASFSFSPRPDDTSTC